MKKENNSGLLFMGLGALVLLPFVAQTAIVSAVVGAVVVAGAVEASSSEETESIESVSMDSPAVDRLREAREKAKLDRLGRK